MSWSGLASSLKEAVIRAMAYRIVVIQATASCMKEGLDTEIAYAERRDDNGNLLDHYHAPTLKVEYSSHSTP